MNAALNKLLAFAAFILVGAAGLGVAWWLRYTNAGPSAIEYMGRFGPQAKIIPAGEVSFDGQPFHCGRRPVLLAPNFDDYGAAFYGFIIINPERFATLPLIIKRYAYTHECGHQFVGWDEEMADCFSIRRGKAEGWLDAKGMDEICAFISRSKGDIRHPPGVHRCQVMRRCFARARPGKEPPGGPSSEVRDTSQHSLTQTSEAKGK